MDPEWEAFKNEVNTNLAPKLADSACSITIYSGKEDIKLAVELGLTILMDKPIILCVTHGAKIPGHLARVADEIIEIDDIPSASDRIMEAVTRVLKLERGRDD